MGGVILLGNTFENAQWRKVKIRSHSSLLSGDWRGSAGVILLGKPLYLYFLFAFCICKLVGRYNPLSSTPCLERVCWVLGCDELHMVLWYCGIMYCGIVNCEATTHSLICCLERVCWVLGAMSLGNPSRSRTIKLSPNIVCRLFCIKERTQAS